MFNINLKKIIILSLLIIIFVNLSVLNLFAEKQYNLALIMPDMVNPFWMYMKQGAEKAAEKYNAKLDVFCPLKPYNVEEQVRFMEDLVQKKIDGIVLVPADSAGVVPGVEKANEAKVPVITTDTQSFGGDIISHIGYDNVISMYTVTKYVLEKLGGKGNIVLLEGTPGTQTGADRKKGMDMAVAEFPQIKVLASQNGDFIRSSGMAVMENLLQRFKKIDAVICANDEMALGAIEAIAAVKREKEMIVSGYDGNQDAYMSIAQGRMYVTLDLNPWALAGEAVEAIIKYLNGENIPKEIQVDLALVNGDNVREYLLKRFGYSLMQ
jgi:ribose transport system substrate-binding protein